MTNNKSRTAPFVICFLLFVISASAQTFPKATGRVNDFANVIDPATEAEIDRQLDQLEKQTSAEIAVATIRSLEGLSSTDYANRLFKQWGVGQAKLDNGVLVVIAIDDRDMAIEVGYGLEGVLPDGLAGQVIREDFTPRLKAGDYSGGIKNGVSRLVGIVEKHQVLTPEELARLNASESTAPFYVTLPFFGVFVAIGFLALGGGIGTHTFNPLIFGTLFGAMPLLMSFLFASSPVFATLVTLAVIMFIVGMRLAMRPSWQATLRDEGKGLRGGPVGKWKMGSSGRSGGSSGSDSGGSSSGSSGSSSDFGGGSSGGGGASGSW